MINIILLNSFPPIKIVLKNIHSRNKKLLEIECRMRLAELYWRPTTKIDIDQHESPPSCLYIRSKEIRWWDCMVWNMMRDVKRETVNRKGMHDYDGNNYDHLLPSKNAEPNDLNGWLSWIWSYSRLQIPNIEYKLDILGNTVSGNKNGNLLKLTL